MDTISDSGLAAGVARLDLRPLDLKDQGDGQRAEERSVGDIQFQCPWCKSPIVLGDVHQQKASCPKCGKVVLVPSSAAAEARENEMEDQAQDHGRRRAPRLTMWGIAFVIAIVILILWWFWPAE